jgi:hypothetical protein
MPPTSPALGGSAEIVHTLRAQTAVSVVENWPPELQIACAL